MAVPLTSSLGIPKKTLSPNQLCRSPQTRLLSPLCLDSTNYLGNISNSASVQGDFPGGFQTAQGPWVVGLEAQRGENVACAGLSSSPALTADFHPESVCAYEALLPRPLSAPLLWGPSVLVLALIPLVRGAACWISPTLSRCQPIALGEAYTDTACLQGQG